MLFPSQTKTKDSLKHALSGANPVVVQGLSGSGKSLIAQDVLSGRLDGMVIEVGEVSSKLDKIKAAVGKRVRVVILAQPDIPVEELSKVLQASPALVKVRCLSAQEATMWVDSIEPSLTPQEKECVLRYSLGVPLLIERLCALRPITQASTLPQCVMYLQSIIERHYLRGEDRDNRLQEILREYTVFEIPDDVLPKLSDCEIARDKSTAMGILHSRLSEGAEFPTPSSLEIFALYDEWLRLHPDEPSFDLFISDVQNAGHILQEIGYCRHPDRDALIGRL